MSYTLKEIGDPGLAAMYREYLAISDRLADGQIEQLEALKRVEQLEVVDNYSATWKVDPSSGTFVMIDANGARTINADPRSFMPSDPSQTTTDVGEIPEYQYTQPEEAPIVLGAKKMVWWKKALLCLGLVALLGASFGAGFVTYHQVNPPTAPVVEDPRPVVEGDGPTGERVVQVLEQLGSGDRSRILYAVPDEEDEDMILWAQATLGSLTGNGFRLVEVRTADNVSVLQVVDRSENVVMQGDLTWVQDSGGDWVLAEVPLMSPVDTDAPPATVESPAPDDSPTSDPEPSDGGGE